MDDRYIRVKELFLLARNVTTGARGAWLDDACGEDAALRRDVESLLSADDEAPRTFLEPDAEPVVSPGSRVSHYRIIERLGAGGMGEVWLAHDETLDRRLALKFPAADGFRDPLVRRRFLREARAAAALEHPAVCRVFELGEFAGHVFIAMEYIKGEPLAALLGRSRVPVEQALSWGVVIAAALEEAHQKGIVHRDLKPGNVMVTSSGEIKVMDFGLARTVPGRVPPDGGDWGSDVTAAGVIAGTPAYMAPEQLRGERVDERADIWALGCVLYELLTGARPFNDVSPAGLIGAILHVEPPALSKDDALIPGLVDRVVRKCLAKDPTARWQTVHDLRDELQWLAEASAEAGFKGLAVTKSRSVARQPVWASIAPPADVTGLGVPMVSPDGRSLVFEGWGAAGPGDLWFRALGGRDARRLPDTSSATLPFFAPDGRTLGFFAEGFLKSLDIASGRVVTLADGCGLFSAGTWAGVSPGVILFSRGASTGLTRVGGAGGSVVDVTPLDAARGDVAHLWPHFLPDGRHFLVVIASAREPGIYLGSLERGVMRRLIETPHILSTAVAYSPSGYLVYLKGGTLVAQRFDIARFQVIGDPVRLAEGVFHYGPGVSAFSISQEGTLVFREDGGWPQWQPVWLDRTGREIGAVGPSGSYWSGTALFQPSGAPDVFRPCISTDSRWLAIAQRQANQHPQIWIVDLQRGTASPFTVGAFNAMPIWSPQGDRLLWGRAADSTPDVYVKSIAESGEGQRLMCHDAQLQRWPTDWSRSGRFVLVDQQSAGPSGWDLIVVDLESEGPRARPYLATPAMERTGVFSPDERWVAYASNVSGAMEVYLSTFPEHGRRWQVSQGGGMLPFWAPDGLELYYVDPQGHVMAVRVRDDDGVLSLSEPEALFRHESSGHLVVGPDGSRFLGLRALDRVPNRPFTLVLDWPQIVRET